MYGEYTDYCGMRVYTYKELIIKGVDMSFYEELDRMSHFGMQDKAEEVEVYMYKVYCSECRVELSDEEAEELGDLCYRCYAKEADDLYRTGKHPDDEA